MASKETDVKTDVVMKRPVVGSAALVVRPNAFAAGGCYPYSVLLGQRGKEPNYGKWVMPGGKIEWGESIEDAAIREVKEETGLDVEITERLGIYEILDSSAHTLFILSRAEEVGGTLKAGDDLADVRWVTEVELPDVDLSEPCRAALRSQGWL